MKKKTLLPEDQKRKTEVLLRWAVIRLRNSKAGGLIRAYH